MPLPPVHVPSLTHRSGYGHWSNLPIWQLHIALFDVTENKKIFGINFYHEWISIAQLCISFKTYH
jgi:hypothetical protein